MHIEYLYQVVPVPTLVQSPQSYKTSSFLVRLTVRPISSIILVLVYLAYAEPFQATLLVIWVPCTRARLVSYTK